MTGGTGFLALDWGTTNLRAWVIGADGHVIRRRNFPLGIGSLAPGEAQQRFLDEVRPAMDAVALPALLCGMIGSNLGWRAIPYLDCPAGPAELAQALHRVEAPDGPVWIVPGLRAARPDGGPDVMRGEEVQLLGWAAGDPTRQRGAHLACLPGTHTKWVLLVDGRVDRFVTAMSGELYSLLRQHSSLRAQGCAENEAAFDAGLSAAGGGGALVSRLFTTRTRVVGGDMPAADVESYLSGLLIGAEVASIPALLGVDPAMPVALIGDPALGTRYRHALTRQGRTSEIHDGDEAVLAGLVALFQGSDITC